MKHSDPAAKAKSRLSNSSEAAPPRHKPQTYFKPSCELSGIRHIADETSLLPSTAASFLYQQSKSESAADIWSGEEELCFCKQCRIARHEFTLSESEEIDKKGSTAVFRGGEFEDRENIPSFRASPKFQDLPQSSPPSDGNLSSFLTEIGLQNLFPVFQEHEVTLSDLFLLTRDDLADMKIPIGPRNRLLQALQRSQNPSLSQSKADIGANSLHSEQELESPRQHSALNVKPVTPEKPPERLSPSPKENDSPVRQHRRQLKEEVEDFLQEVSELFSRSQRRKTIEPAPVQVQTVPQNMVSTDQMALLKSLLDGREVLEKGLETMQRSLSDLKDSRNSRGASPIQTEHSSKRLSASPKTKVPLNMKKGLITKLKCPVLGNSISIDL